MIVAEASQSPTSLGQGYHKEGHGRIISLEEAQRPCENTLSVVIPFWVFVDGARSEGDGYADPSFSPIVQLLERNIKLVASG